MQDMRIKAKVTMELGWLGWFESDGWLKLGWFNSGDWTCWLLRSQIVPKEINAPRSKNGPTLGSSRYAESPLRTPRTLCFRFCKGIFCADMDQIGSVSSGTSLGVRSVCNDEMVFALSANYAELIPSKTISHFKALTWAIMKL